MTGLSAHLHPGTFGAEIGELENSHSRSWQDQLNDCGSGQITLDNDDPDVDACALDTIIRFDLDGEPAFAFLVEKKVRYSIHDEEEISEVTEIKGRGTLAIWDRIVVYPEAPLDWQPFADDRLFSFASIAFDDSGWAPTVETAGEFVYPDDWPDPAAAFIWDRDLLGVGVYAPAGPVYFRKAFTTVVDQMVELRAAADDAFDAYVDGVRLLSDGPYATGRSQSVQFRLSPGDHLLAVRANNANALKAWLLLTLMVANSDGTLGAVVVDTDDTWLCDAYPATPPGFTAGAIIRTLFDEAQARGAIPDVTLGFTDTLDSDGVAWPDAPDVAFRVGLDGLSALRQLAETYVDIVHTPDALHLNAYVAGGRGAGTAVALHAPTDPDDPATGNLLELTHETA